MLDLVPAHHLFKSKGHIKHNGNERCTMKLKFAGLVSTQADGSN